MMTASLTTALDPINAMIGALSPKLRGALVEELVEEISRDRPDAESRKARVLDSIVANALRDAPMSSRVRASPKLVRCIGSLPDTVTAIACDVVAVAEAVLVANDMPDAILSEVCTADRQEHMRVIAKRPSVFCGGRRQDRAARRKRDGSSSGEKCRRPAVPCGIRRHCGTAGNRSRDPIRPEPARRLPFRDRRQDRHAHERGLVR